MADRDSSRLLLRTSARAPPRLPAFCLVAGRWSRCGDARPGEVDRLPGRLLLLLPEPRQGRGVDDPVGLEADQAVEALAPAEGRPAGERQGVADDAALVDRDRDVGPATAVALARHPDRHGAVVAQGHHLL